MRSIDPNIQSEEIKFKREDLIVCKGCGRSNPPNRFNCIYCAFELEILPSNAVSIKFTSRKLETWERGHNVVLIKQNGSIQNVQSIATMLNIKPNALSNVIETETPFPVARVESEKEAAFICNCLEENGFACSIVPDEKLAIDKPHVRLSGMEFTDEKLAIVNFNSHNRTEIKWSDLTHIISGVLTKSRVDSLEKKRRRGITKVIDETATSSDEQIFDLYANDDAIGYRVSQAGFDFSCLRDDKGLLASENIRLLTAELKERAYNAKYINSYDRVRPLLDDIWEIESRTDYHGLRRSGFGKVEFGSAVSTSNLMQFNKFSRLQWHLR